MPPRGRNVTLRGIFLRLRQERKRIGGGSGTLNDSTDEGDADSYSNSGSELDYESVPDDTAGLPQTNEANIDIANVEESGKLDRIDRRILAWCINQLDHPLDGLAGDEYRSPLVGALAILGIRSDGGWESAGGYTQKLSAFIRSHVYCVYSTPGRLGGDWVRVPAT